MEKGQGREERESPEAAEAADGSIYFCGGIHMLVSLPRLPPVVPLVSTAPHWAEQNSWGHTLFTATLTRPWISSPAIKKVDDLELQFRCRVLA